MSALEAVDACPAIGWEARAPDSEVVARVERGLAAGEDEGEDGDAHAYEVALDRAGATAGRLLR
jgi:hypothetical protein